MESQQTKKCPACAETILADARKCKHCGEYLDGTAPKAQVIIVKPDASGSPGVGAVLSFFIPGLGQLYRGRIFRGILWFIFVLIGYVALVVPGIILHLLCVIDAYDIGSEAKA